MGDPLPSRDTLLVLELRSAVERGAGKRLLSQIVTTFDERHAAPPPRSAG